SCHCWGWSDMSENERKPSIRFAGFDDAWEQRKLGVIANIIDPHPSHRAPAATIEGIPFIGIGDVDVEGNINHTSARVVDEKIYDEHHSRYDLSIKSIGIGRVASLGKVIRLRNDIGKYAVSPTMAVIQFHNIYDLDYLYACMNTPIFQEQFISYSNGSTRQSVGIQDLRNLFIDIPNDTMEQKRIGAFFLGLDNLITLHQRKYDKLVSVKKSMLEKMFPKNGSNIPEIRFSGFTDPWEQRKLGEMAVFRRGLTYRPTDVCDNGIRVLRSSNIDEVTFVLKDDDVFVQTEAINISFVKENDILITAANGSSRLVGKHALIKGMPDKTAVHGGFMLLATAKNPNFTNALMSSPWYASFINTYVAGGNGAIGNLSKSDLEEQNVYVPKQEEQESIGAFFSNLDNLITLHQRKLEKLKNIKKSMLEKMFV
ncbi:MAG: restriction endonuclease subunit S, partial [Clostridia bacterium]|nr:restriction endonuclease subunit S [Clostridia bacterium]